MTDRQSDWDTAGRAVISAGLLYAAIAVTGVVAVAITAPLTFILLLEAAAFVSALITVVVAVFWVSTLRRMARAHGHDPRRVAHGGLSLWALTLVVSVLLVLAGLLMDDAAHPALLMTRMGLRLAGAIGLILGVRLTRARLRHLLAGAPPPPPPPAQRPAEPTRADWDASNLGADAREHLERKRKIYYD